ncbi:hypothetical protein E4U60_007237, partial [Claviceps pazoutovae]
GGNGYLLPVDTEEQERLATANPSCHVTGTDISAFQRPHSLPNLNFVLHDIEKDAWPAQYGGDYDYIHLRYTVTCFDSTPAVLRRAFELLRPGGWIEFYDPNHVFLPVDRPLEGTALGKWISSVVEGAQRVGRDFLKPTKYVGWMRDAGFTDVTETRFGIPTNPWAKDARLKKMGRLNAKNELAVVGSLGKTLRLAVEDEKEAEALEEGARRDVQDPNLHFFREMRAKPETVDGQDANADLGLYLNFNDKDAGKPQPLRGDYGGTANGPQTYEYEKLNSDSFAPPGTDKGSVPNAKWPLGLSHNQPGYKGKAGWARQQNKSHLPAAKTYPYRIGSVQAVIVFQ